MRAQRSTLLRKAAWWTLAALVGMSVDCKRQKAPPVTAAPSPTVAAAAEPFSSPQTTYRLPPAQPIPPEALPPEQPAERPASPEVRPSPAPSPPAKPVERRPSHPEAPVTPPAQTPTPAEENPAVSPQLRPILTPAQEAQLLQIIDRDLTSARRMLNQAGSRSADKEAVERLRTFVEQADRARRQGDLNRARSLAERAAVLAADLAGAAR